MGIYLTVSAGEPEGPDSIGDLEPVGAELAGTVMELTITVAGAVMEPTGAVAGTVMESIGAVTGTVIEPTGVVAGIVMEPTGVVAGTVMELVHAGARPVSIDGMAIGKSGSAFFILLTTSPCTAWYRSSSRTQGLQMKPLLIASASISRSRSPCRF